MDSWFFLSFPRYVDSAIRGSGRGEEPSGANVLRLNRIRLTTPSLEKTTPASQDNLQRLEPSIQGQQTHLTFPLRAQRNVFRRGDVRQQSRLQPIAYGFLIHLLYRLDCKFAQVFTCRESHRGLKSSSSNASIRQLESISNTFFKYFFSIFDLSQLAIITSQIIINNCFAGEFRQGIN